MRSRIFFLTIACCWLAMNDLLWRSQWDALEDGFLALTAAGIGSPAVE